MGALSRDEKLIVILKQHVGQWVSARNLMEALAKTFSVKVGFFSARSLALYLRRFGFKREKNLYFIDLKKIEIRRRKTKIWKEVFK